MNSARTTAPFPLQTNSSRTAKGTGSTERHPSSPQARGLSYRHTSQPAERTLSIAVGGRWAKLTFSDPDRPKMGEGKRGAINGFSRSSRLRLWQSVLQMATARLPEYCSMVTLTYPDLWPSEPFVWKLHFDDWVKLFLREYPGSILLWKLEPQERGAPHFHCLVWHHRKLRRKFVKESWYACRKETDRRSYRAGTRIDEIESIEKAIAYTAKYCSKEVEDAGWDKPGRFWGWRNRKYRPVTLETFDLPSHIWFRVRRLMRRTMQSPKGFHQPGGPLSGCWIQWRWGTILEVLDWFEREDSPPDTQKGKAHFSQMVSAEESVRRADRSRFTTTCMDSRTFSRSS